MYGIFTFGLQNKMIFILQDGKKASNCIEHLSFGKCCNKSIKKEETTMEIVKTASVEQEVECCGPMSLIS